MINMQDVVSDPDLRPSQPFTILRSTGTWVEGGFQSTTFPITILGPVQQASPKEIAMLPEADRVGSVRAFWTTIQVYTTRGYAPAPTTHGETPMGSVPGTVFTLSQAPPGGACDVYVGGLLEPSTAYVLSGNVVTLAVQAAVAPYIIWTVEADVQAAASDKIQWEGHTYRILTTQYDPGSGYWKSMGTREEAA